MVWTNIGDTFLEPGKPIRSADLIALRDNPIAIAEGAAGAPLLGQGIATNGTSGAVGTYALALSSGDLNFGNTTSGSNLKATNAAGSSATPSLTGTWRCMGRVVTGNSATRSTVFLRIS